MANSTSCYWLQLGTVENTLPDTSYVQELLFLHRTFEWSGKIRVT